MFRSRPTERSYGGEITDRFAYSGDAKPPGTGSLTHGCLHDFLDQQKRVLCSEISGCKSPSKELSKQIN